jgi:hypothetical protein
MKGERVLAGVVLLGSTSGCGDYATKTELNQLQAEYVATHDTPHRPRYGAAAAVRAALLTVCTAA